MPIERVQWTCPGCRRKYAIPATAPTPALCPSCRKTAEEATPLSPAESASVELPVNELQVNPVEEIHIESEPVQIPPLLEPRQTSKPSIQRRRLSTRKRKYPALRAISLGYKVLAGLMALVAVAALLYAVYSAVTVKEAEERTEAIYLGMGVFLGGGLVAVGHLACGELIQVGIDIEENTRKRDDETASAEL